MSKNTLKYFLKIWVFLKYFFKLTELVSRPFYLIIDNRGLALLGNFFCIFGKANFFQCSVKVLEVGLPRGQEVGLAGKDLCSKPSSSW